MTDPVAARAAFLYAVATPWEVYRAISKTPMGERGELVRFAAARFGVSTRTIYRRVARYWPPALEEQEPGEFHEVRCDRNPCTCFEVILV